MSKANTAKLSLKLRQKGGDDLSSCDTLASSFFCGSGERCCGRRRKGGLAAGDGCGGQRGVASWWRGAEGDALVKCRASITFPLIWQTYQFLAPSILSNGGSALTPAASTASQPEWWTRKPHGCQGSGCCSRSRSRGSASYHYKLLECPRVFTMKRQQTSSYR